VRAIRQASLANVSAVAVALEPVDVYDCVMVGTAARRDVGTMVGSIVSPLTRAGSRKALSTTVGT